MMDEQFNQGMDKIENMSPRNQFAPPKKSKKKLLISTGVIGLVVVVSAGAFFILRNDKPAVSQSPPSRQQENVSAEKKRVRGIATGDMIPHDAINKEAKQADGTYEYTPMFSEMNKLFADSDVNFCNQAVLGGGTEFKITGYPIFNSPTEFARDMNELGCNLVNTGSNHTNDLNQAVVDASVAAWDKLPGMLAVAGANRTEAEKQKVRYFEVKGVKFAFVSYTTYSNKPSPNGYSVTMYNEALARTQLQEARSKADIVIASMRWGTEYSPNVTNQQRTWGKTIADMGADIIVGHGPHVLEPVERFTTSDGREAIAWYSLGNFFNAQLENEGLFNGIATMDINPETKKIETVSYLPVYMHYEWTAAQKANEELLTRKNFSMFTFEDGQDALSRSQTGTTFEAQKQRIQDTLNKLTEVKLITKDQYLQS